MPAGRPTDYRPEYCDQVIEWGKMGKSRAWICAALDVVPQTLLNWEAAHPEFLEATTRALVYSQQWWEDAGQSGMTVPAFQGTVWAKNMSNRFKRDWRDETKTIQSGDPENPVRHVHKIERVIIG